MKAAFVTAITFVSIANAQPIRNDKWVANIQKPPAERAEVCRAGCYLLTSKELADGLQNAARLATLRAAHPRPSAAKKEGQQ